MRKPYRFLAIGLLSVLLVVTASARATSPVRAQSAQTTSDLAIQMTADRNRVRAGNEVTYTVTMTNLGPDDASFVSVIFDIPSELLLISMTCDLGVSADTPACEYQQLPVGTTLVTTLTVTPNPAIKSAGHLVTMTANATFLDLGFVDPNLANNTASIRTRIVGRLPHR